eukprot:5317108-Pyramimonas_sp.AAC.1
MAGVSGRSVVLWVDRKNVSSGRPSLMGPTNHVTDPNGHRKTYNCRHFAAPEAEHGGNFKRGHRLCVDCEDMGSALHFGNPSGQCEPCNVACGSLVCE